MDDRLLEVRNLTVSYGVGRRAATFNAVDDVTLDICAEETVALVGESGSGKTTLGRAILGLAPVTRGTILFRGTEIAHASYKQRRALSRELQIVFQDPYSSLNPATTIGQTLAETLRPHGPVSKEETQARMTEMLERVGLPVDAASRYPSHFSGGQRQRIAIARALMVQPSLVICDEALSALDLSVQAQILNLLRELQEQLGLSYLFISHDLAVVRYLAHRIAVMYRGRIMELGTAADVYDRPSHPYTQALLSAAPVPDPEAQRIRRSAQQARAADTVAVEGTSSAGCPFVSRCQHRTQICVDVVPVLEETPEGGKVACHRWRDIRAFSRSSPAAADTPYSVHETTRLPGDRGQVAESRGG